MGLRKELNTSKKRPCSILYAGCQSPLRVPASRLYKDLGRIIQDERIESRKQKVKIVYIHELSSSTAVWLLFLFLDSYKMRERE